MDDSSRNPELTSGANTLEGLLGVLTSLSEYKHGQSVNCNCDCSSAVAVEDKKKSSEVVRCQYFGSDNRVFEDDKVLKCPHCGAGLRGVRSRNSSDDMVRSELKAELLQMELTHRMLLPQPRMSPSEVAYAMDKARLTAREALREKIRSEIVGTAGILGLAVAIVGLCYFLNLKGIIP